MGSSILRTVFDAPFQSFGSKSYWDNRDTQMFPTKSSVIGLIANAKGLERGDTQIDDLAKNLKVHVRIDKKGCILRDDQTVNEAVSEAGLDYSSFKIKKIDKNTYFHPLLEKYYVCDAIFTVFIEGDSEIISDCSEALKSPKRVLYIGRKCCIPSSPLFIEEPIVDYENIDTLIHDVSNIDMDRIFKDGVSNYYFDCIVEDICGNTVSFDNPDSRGQKCYGARGLRKFTFTKNITKENGVYVFK